MEIGRQLRYLNKLCGRMQRMTFPVDDPLSQRATDARNAVQSLYGEVLTSGRVSPKNPMRRGGAEDSIQERNRPQMNTDERR